MAVKKTKHALFVPASGWGHLRPLASLAAKLVHERPDIIITFTLTGDFKTKLDNELDRYFTDDERALKDNIRLLRLGGLDNMDLLGRLQAYFRGFAELYPTLYAEEPVSCATGQTYEAITRPDVVLLDPFLLEALRTIRKVSGNTVPVLAWNSAALNFILRLCGPVSLGGLGDVLAKAEALAKETGKSTDEFLTQLYSPETGNVIKLPGMPAMYDYEYNSYHISPRVIGFQNIIFPAIFKFFEECDGIIALGNASFEPEVCAAYGTWFTPRPVYFVGPLVPDERSVGYKLTNSQERELNGSSNGAEVKSFLDTIQKTHGDYSLLYIAFGSHFWPMGDGVWKVLEVVLDMKIPLILSYSPERAAEMPSHIHEQLQISEFALVSAWAPQHLILGHQATGWFMTHCGNNSVTEAVSHGVPMIAWPLGADQPFNAAYMSSVMNVAYELFETRLGGGLRPLLRGVHPEGTLEAIEKEARSVFNKARGLDGAQKRKNIQTLSKKVNAAWGEHGEARKELRRFLSEFLAEN